MALLSSTAIRYLEDLAGRGDWIDVDELGALAERCGPLGELQRARLVEVQTSVRGTGRRPAAWRRGPAAPRGRGPRREVRITWRGRDRLERIQAGRRRRTARSAAVGL